MLVCVLLSVLGTAVAAPIGFQAILVPNGDEPPLRGAIWYPSTGTPRAEPLETFTQQVVPDGPVAGRHLPVIVLSHGGGGTFAGHYDTALALADAGFVVAAINHAGDTFGDEGQVLKLWRRPEQLRRLVSFVLDDWADHERVDASRVGAFGFSNGGFTVLVAAGAKPDLALTDPYCRRNPDHELCAALRQAGVKSVGAMPSPANAWARDPRIKAIAVAAPGFAFTFAGGLGDETLPTQLWLGANDRRHPEPWYGEVVRAGLPSAPELHVVAGAGHYDFLAPCSPTLLRVAPQICTETDGFDRAAFHRRMNTQIAQFFEAHLRSHAEAARPSGN